MTTDCDALQTELISVIQKLTKTDIEITESLHIMNDLDLDSVMVMELMMELEDHFDISIPLNALPDVHTVKDLTAEIAKLKDQAS